MENKNKENLKIENKMTLLHPSLLDSLLSRNDEEIKNNVFNFLNKNFDDIKAELENNMNIFKKIKAAKVFGQLFNKYCLDKDSKNKKVEINAVKLFDSFKNVHEQTKSEKIEEVKKKSVQEGSGDHLLSLNCIWNKKLSIFLNENDHICYVVALDEVNDKDYECQMMILICIAMGYNLICCTKSIKLPNFFFDDLFTEFHLSSEEKRIRLPNVNPRITHYFFYISHDAKLEMEKKTQEKKTELLTKENCSSYFHIIKLSDGLCGLLDPDDKNYPFDFNKPDNKTSEMVPVYLFNIPLFEKIGDSAPKCFSGRSVMYINIHDFEKLHFSDGNISKVQLFGKGEKTCYALFEDIHKLKPELCVKEQVSLSNATKDDLKNVEKIIKNLKSKAITKIPNPFYITESDYRHMIQAALSNMPRIEHRSSQIFAILKASKAMLEGIYDKENGGSRGVVYQIDTGEGKSMIIKALAAILASNKRKVHIVTSNIELAKRDFNDSKDYFKKLDISTEILIHENECKKSSDDSGEVIMPNNKNWDKASGMNIEGAMEADIVFSTFLNFEGAFLHFQESDPEKINEIGKRILIIDEADSMLIDEITNGTILSKQIKSTTNECLTRFYEKAKKIKGPSEDKNEYRPRIKESLANIMEELNGDFKKEVIDCKLTVDDMNDIFDDYCDAMDKINGREYIVDDKNFETDKEKEDAIKNKEPIKVIVPFDFDHKGMAEPTKEFMGYIQQFIAIKENDKLNERIKEKNENQGTGSKELNEYENMIEIKQLSFTTMYTSHQIYVSKYLRVCGFTGTVGNERDANIFKEKYDLGTCKIQRHKPNMRNDMKTIFGEDEKERNYLILDEIRNFNKRNYPVLAIFQEISELDRFNELINKDNELSTKKRMIFKGNEKGKPNYEECGKPGAITLSTNCVGRGTDIILSEEAEHLGVSLHVIVSYSSSNDRVLQQAYGRTARKGQQGSSRIICTINSLIDAYKGKLSDPNRINDVYGSKLREFEKHTQLQKDFLVLITNMMPWVFHPVNKFKPANDKKFFEFLRDNEVIISRKTAAFYQFPMTMKLEQFVNIQAQRIVSLYCCPNTKYTWYMIAKYYKELLLESFALASDDLKRKQTKDGKDEKDELYIFKTVLEAISKIIPINAKKLGLFKDYEKKNSEELFKVIDKVIDMSKIDIYECFMKTYEYVSKGLKTTTAICKKIKTKFAKSAKLTATIGYVFQNITESGARIGGKGEKIIDPEYKYLSEKDDPNSVISITQTVDWLIDGMYNSLQPLLEKMNANIYFRRTLAGGELGIFTKSEAICEPLQRRQFDLSDTEQVFVTSFNIRRDTPIMSGIMLLAIKLYVNNQLRQIMGIKTDIGAIMAGNSEKPTKSNEEIEKALNEEIKTSLKDKQFDKFKDAINILEAVFDCKLNAKKNKEMKKKELLKDRIAISTVILFAFFVLKISDGYKASECDKAAEAFDEAKPDDKKGEKAGKLCKNVLEKYKF